jgi:hypothetical protein
MERDPSFERPSDDAAPSGETPDGTVGELRDRDEETGDGIPDGLGRGNPQGIEPTGDDAVGGGGHGR